MSSQTRKSVCIIVICMSALTLLWAVFGASNGVAQASAIQQSTTNAITETLSLDQDKMDKSMAMSETIPADTNPMDSAAHLEQMMARMEAMESRMAAMEKRMGGQAAPTGNSCMMMSQAMMDQGMMKGGMMSSMAEMHAMMAEMHAQMAMMSMMSDMPGMMGQGMMGQGGMMGQSAPPTDMAPKSSTDPASAVSSTATTATSSAQTETVGELEIKLTPLDLSNLAAETIAFTVDLNSSSGDIKVDLAKLAFIEAGMEVEAAAWDVVLDHGHHVQGTLTFPLTHGGGHRYLDGAKSVTVVIHAAQGDEKVSFTWPLP